MIDLPFIKIDKDVFDNAEYDELVLLLGLLHFDPEKKGVFKAKFYVNADLSKSLNYDKLSKTYKELLGMYYDEAILTKPKYRIVPNQNQHTNHFLLHEAIRFFQTPISLILENSLNDGYFMKAIFKHFDKSNILLTYYNYGWLQFENAGGFPNIENFITSKIEAFKGYSKKMQTEPEKHIRCFVLMDSDKKNKGEPLSSKKINLEKFLLQLNITVHILNKKAMENYLTDNAVRQLNTYNYQLEDRSETTKMANWKSNPSTQMWLDTYIGLEKSEKDYKEFEELNMPFAKREIPKFFGYNDYIEIQGLLDREGGTEDENEFLEIISKIGLLL